MSRRYGEAEKAFGKKKFSKDDVLEAIAPVFSKPGEPGFRTKQSFKDQCDINKIMDKARKTGTISHVGKYGSEYGDYSDIPTLLEAEQQLIRAREIFEDAPAEVRREFDQDVGKFFAWVNDPANADDVPGKLADVARRGDQMPVVRGGDARVAEAAMAAVRDAPSPDTGGDVSEPQGGSGEA